MDTVQKHIYSKIYSAQNSFITRLNQFTQDIGY
jgi:hypothetical protein